MVKVKSGNNKYKARPMSCSQGHRHQSSKEARRCNDLTLLERAGEISGLKLQESFALNVNGHKICTYKADFSYWQKGEEIVEDVKGVRTRDYVIKRKLMAAIYGIEVRET